MVKGDVGLWRSQTGFVGLASCINGAGVVDDRGIRKGTAGADIPQEAPDDVLQQSDGLCLHQTHDHVTQDLSHGVETLVRRADVV